MEATNFGTLSLDAKRDLYLYAGSAQDLAAALLVVDRNKDHASIKDIASRKSKQSGSDGNLEYMVTLSYDGDDTNCNIPNLLENVKGVKLFDTNQDKWIDFPKHISDLDAFTEKILHLGEGRLESDHPGAQDAKYVERRQMIAKVAMAYKYGQPLPRTEYTQSELDTWRTVYNKLKELYPTHACAEHQNAFPLLEKHCGFHADNIPQIADISRFLESCTGFTLRPVAGLLSSRDFLNAFAFRVFHSTQYIRHHSQPLYTPEPDLCHELLGHVPLLADPEFADFSHEIGLASLGVSDADIEKLATLYWFTVEFGVCRQNGKLRAYGAGLLSSFGELEYCLSDKPKMLEFDPAVMSVTEYPITCYQPTYFVAESFKDAQLKVREFAQTLARPFTVHYNALTKTVEVIDSVDQVRRRIHAVETELATISDALNRF